MQTTAGALNFAAGGYTTGYAQFDAPSGVTISGLFTQTGTGGVFTDGGTLTVTGELDAAFLASRRTYGAADVAFTNAVVKLNAGAPNVPALSVDGTLTLIGTTLIADTGQVAIGQTQAVAASAVNSTVGAYTTYVGFGTGAADTLAITGGSWTDSAGNGVVSLAVGGTANGKSGSGAVTLGSAARLTDHGAVVLGGGAGSAGAVTVTGAAWTVDGLLSIGQGGTGTVGVSGPAASLTAKDDVIVGNGGTGTLTVSGAVVTVGGVLSIANGHAPGTATGTGFDGTVTIADGARLTAAMLSIGTDGGRGTLEVDAASATIGAPLQAGGTGTARIVLRNGGSIKSGEGTAGTAFLTLSGGPQSAASSLELHSSVLDAGANGLIIGNTGIATASAGEGSQIYAGGPVALVLGSRADGVGTLTVRDTGTAAVFDGQVQVGAAGTGTLDVIGASVTAASLSVASGAGATGQVLIDGGRLTVTEAAAFGADGEAGSTSARLAVSGHGAFFASALAMAGGQAVPTIQVDATSVIQIGGGTAGAGGALTIDAGAVLGGSGLIAGSVRNAGAIVVLEAGTLSVQGAYSGTGTVLLDDGARFVLRAPLAPAPPPGTQTLSVLFGAASVLEAGAGLSLGGTLTNFAGTDALDFAGYTVTRLTASAQGGRLTVYAGATRIADFALAGRSVSAGGLRVVDDGHGGAEVMACFAEGTRLATPAGPAAVETLGPGDTLRLADGTDRPIIWTGHRTVDCARHASPRDVWPVEIAPHAFGPDQPRRPLRLSPDHGVFADGALIPVKHLIDGDAVRQVPAPSVTYWHVELARHDVLLAEDLPCESYLDTGDRDRFAGAGGPADAAFVRRAREAACAPLEVTGPRVAAVRRRLAAAGSRAAA